MFGLKLQKWVFGIFISLIVIGVISYAFLGDDVSVELLRQAVNNFGIWSPLVFILLYIVGTMFIPSTPFMLLAGILFGFWYGLLYTILAGLFSALITFKISRHLGQFWVESILKSKYMRLLQTYNTRLERGAIWDMIAWRIAPMPFNTLNLLMGVSRISTRDYVIGTVLGLIPSNLITVYAGVLIYKIL